MTDASPHWTGRLGAWVGIGASPAALVLGSQLAGRHDAPLAVAALVVGAIGMVGILVWQGRMGVRPPAGEDETFGAFAPRYFRRGAASAISAVLAAVMVGWMGFNAGLGGAAFAELSGLHQLLTSSALVLMVVALAIAGMRWWNWLALAATAATLVLIVVVVVSVEPSASPVTSRLPVPARLLTDVAALVGYVSVFALRAPDFTVGLARTRDVLWPALLMVGITIAVAAAGVAVAEASGEVDVITVISERVSAGNVLLVLAVVPAMLTSFHSGVLALVASTRISPPAARGIVALSGVVLGIARFDRHLVLWLGALSAVLVPVMVPLAVEVWRRRRRRSPQRIGTWSWAPGSVVGAAGTVLGWHLALPAAVLTAFALTWAGAHRRTGVPCPASS